SAFPVDIDEIHTVAALKDAICAANPAIIACEAQGLQLFLAKRGGKWLSETRAAAAVALDNLGYPRGFEHMNPFSSLKNDACFGEKFQPMKGQIHVLIVVP
ncbi:hypothetical protein PHYSODRAFT_369612, partial [Phytophthora sojae]